MNRGGRVGGCFGHPPCLLLNPGAPLFFSISASGRGLTASYLQVLYTHLRRSPIAVHLSTHRSSGISYYRLQLTQLAMSVGVSRLFAVFVSDLSSKKEMCSPAADFIPRFSSAVIVEFGVISLYLEPIPSHSNSILHYYFRDAPWWALLCTHVHSFSLFVTLSVSFGLALIIVASHPVCWNRHPFQ